MPYPSGTKVADERSQKRTAKLITNATNTGNQVLL